jgi:hypothetical protein
MTHQPDRATDTHTERADLEALGAELSALGCKTILTTGEGRQPRLDVLNPLAPAISRCIYAQADYFFWRTTAEPIAPRTAVPAAANLIARALAATPIRTAARTPGRSPAA